MHAQYLFIRLLLMYSIIPGSCSRTVSVCKIRVISMGVDQLHPRCFFEERVAVLEGGIAGLAVASGAAAITYAFENITRASDHIVAAKTILRGSYNLLAHVTQLWSYYHVR